MEKVTKIEWSKTAEKALENIYNFYIEKSEKSALNILDNIIQTAESITHSKQYQIDDINPNYRRMIVGHHKILYKEKRSRIWIMNIIDTRQNPVILENF